MYLYSTVLRHNSQSASQKTLTYKNENKRYSDTIPIQYKMHKEYIIITVCNEISKQYVVKVHNKYLVNT